MLAEVRDMCQESAELHAAERFGEALVVAEAAVKLARRDLGPEHHAYILSLCALAAARHGAGLDARELYAEVEEKARKLADSDFEHARAALTHAWSYWTETGDTMREKGVQAHILDLLRTHLGEDHPRYLMAKAAMYRDPLAR